MGLRDIEATLPPGFRFYPRDEELVCHYLYRKIANDQSLSKGTMVEVDLHTCEPWQLPDEAKLGAKEWYFFNLRERKYATGQRTNRATKCGYWKATGKDRPVAMMESSSTQNAQVVVGMRKTLVFHLNRAPHGLKTGWIMHEFRLAFDYLPNLLPNYKDWVLCRVFHKSKGELATSKLNLENYDDFDTTMDVSLYGLPDDLDQNMQNGHHQLIISSSEASQYNKNGHGPSDLQNLAGIMSPDFLFTTQECQDEKSAPINVIDSKRGDDDQYGYLFLDMD